MFFQRPKASYEQSEVETWKYSCGATASRESREIPGSPTKRYNIIMFKQILGITLLIAGLVGLILPIIPGGILVYFGLQVAGISLLKDKLPVLKTRVKKFLEK